MQSSPEEKIRLFRAMFCGREDVFAERWESKAGKTGYQPACANQWIRGVCPKCAAFGRGGAKKVPVSCAECPVRQFEPISDRVIANHLRGSGEKGKPFTMGVYPLLADDTVRFAAIDFDKASWRADVHSVRVLPSSPWRSTGNDTSPTRTPIAATVAKTSSCKARATSSCGFLRKTSFQISAVSSTASCVICRRGPN